MPGWITSLVCSLCLMVTPPAFAEKLVLGSINDNIRKQVDRLTPLAEFLEHELADHGITSVEINITAQSDEMMRAMREGRVHIYFDSPLIATQVADETGGTPILRRWKRGVGTYHSLIIVPVDSNIETVEDLVNRRIGFQDPDSTSGFMLPAGILLNAGLELQQLGSAREPVSHGTVGYLFTADDKNTILWLARGRIDAAATDPRAFALLQKARPGQFRAIARSVEVPRQVVVAGPHLEPELRARIEALLIGLSDTEEGVEIMRKYHETTAFDRFPDGIEATFTPIRKLLLDLRRFGVIG